MAPSKKKYHTDRYEAKLKIFEGIKDSSAKVPDCYVSLEEAQRRFGVKRQV